MFSTREREEAPDTMYHNIIIIIIIETVFHFVVAQLHPHSQIHEHNHVKMTIIISSPCTKLYSITTNVML